MAIESKLVFCGPMGAGKTTAIRAISEIPPISTDVINTDFSESAKDETTVALDYGELTLEDGQKLLLYGTPGQRRFEFMWPLVARGALGIVILLDQSRPDPHGDLEGFLDAFETQIVDGRVVVAVGRLQQGVDAALQAYRELLGRRGLFAPVMPADVRRRDEVLRVLRVLFHQIEACSAGDEDTLLSDLLAAGS